MNSLRADLHSLHQKKVKTRATGFVPSPRPVLLGQAPVAAGPTPWILDFRPLQPGFNPGPMITQAAFGAHGRDTAEGEATPQGVPGPSATPGPAPDLLSGSVVRKPLFVVAPPTSGNAIVPPLSAALQVPSVSVANPGCLSRIPDPDLYLSRIPGLGFRITDPGSRISDPGSRIPDPGCTKRGGGKNCVGRTILYSHKYHKIVIILFLNRHRIVY